MSVALEARDITKVYGHVSALSGANFEVKAGEVIALIGDNGAGKSTLVKILSGTETPTSGEILVDGKPVTISGPLAARGYGIETVYQDLALAPHLNPVQNMYLGREVMRTGVMGRLGFMNNAEMLAGSKKAFDELGATVRNFSGSIGAMSGGQKQAVAVARAAAWAKRIVLLDEPTAALGVVQTKARPGPDPPGPRPRARRGVHQPLDAARDPGCRRGAGHAARSAGGHVQSKGDNDGGVGRSDDRRRDAGEPVMTGQATVPPPAPAEVVPSEEQPTGRLARLARLQALQIIIVLAVIVVIFSAIKPGSFLTVFNIRGIVQDTSILAVLGVGMTFVIITGGIDLSVGSVLVFSGVVADKAMAAMGGQGWGAAIVGALVAIGCGLGWGLINGVLIARAKVPPLIVTLGTLGMALGLAEVITGGVDLRDIPTVMVNSVGFGNIFWQVPTLAIIAAVVIVIGIVALHRTRFGLYTYALGSNPEAGRRSGLNVPRHLIKVYALSGLLAGFAGWLNLAFFQSTTIGGQSTTNLSVIAGTVIGGTSLFGGYGSILGTTIGLFIPTTLQNGFVIIGIQPFWQEVVVGAVLIAAVYVDQQRRAAALRGGRPTMSTWLSQLTSRQAAPARE